MDAEQFRKMMDAQQIMSSRLDSIQRDIANILTAFPDGVASHAAEHKISIQDAQENSKLKFIFKEKAITVSTWALIAATLAGLWTNFKDHLK